MASSFHLLNDVFFRSGVIVAIMDSKIRFTTFSEMACWLSPWRLTAPLKSLYVI